MPTKKQGKAMNSIIQRFSCIQNSENSPKRDRDLNYNNTQNSLDVHDDQSS